MQKKTTKNLKTKKASVLESAIKNVKGKQAVKPAKVNQTTKCILCSILIIFAGLFALGLILMVYFQNDGLWSRCANVNMNKSGEINKQVAPAALANPASTFCSENGGQWKTWNNNVGEGGVCYYSESRQCEEWAMFRGECPVGGADLSAYTDNKSKQYCLMVGGTVVDDNDCTLPSGTTCNLVELLSGVCLAQ